MYCTFLEGHSTHPIRPNGGYPRCLPVPSNLDRGQLITSARQFLEGGLAATTRTTYAAGIRRYTSFCKATNLRTLPTSESTLILFVTHLATGNISQATIKVYLSAVRHIHVLRGLHNSFSQQLTPRLQIILKGIKKHQAISHPSRVRLPITVHILNRIRGILRHKNPSYSEALLWAACCLAFFGFLRVSEFTIPSTAAYDPTCHLSLKDIAVDNRDNPHLLQVAIKQSKTDPFRRGVNIYLGATDCAICPVKAILAYLAMRSDQAGPLFITQKGRGLTRQVFSSALDSLLSKLKLDCKQYNTHSFRIGAATSATQARIPDSHIKLLGRWQSGAYQRYIKTPPTELAKLSKKLVSSL